MFTTLNWHIVFAIFSSCLSSTASIFRNNPDLGLRQQAETSWSEAKSFHSALRRRPPQKLRFGGHGGHGADAVRVKSPQIRPQKKPHWVCSTLSQSPSCEANALSPWKFHQFKDKNAEGPEDQTVQSWEHMACRDWPEGSQFNGDEDSGCDLCFPSTSFPNISLH